MYINIHINPWSSRNIVLVEETLMGETLYKVYVTAPPIDGKANEALIKLIADFFSVKKRQIRIVSGFKSRYKVLDVSVD